MSDIFEPEKRSEIMSKIRGKNTKVELTVYSYLRKEGVYFQKHYRGKFKVRLDVALPRKKRAVFIDGDFWHGRSLERVRQQRGKEDFWTKKLVRNIERDKEQNAILTDNGWTVLRVWESDILRKRTREQSLEKIKGFLIT